MVGGEGFKVLARRAGRTGRVVRLAGTDAHTHTRTEKRLSRGGRPRHTPRKWTRQALDLTAGAAGLDGWGGCRGVMYRFLCLLFWLICVLLLLSQSNLIDTTGLGPGPPQHAGMTGL